MATEQIQKTGTEKQDTERKAVTQAIRSALVALPENARHPLALHRPRGAGPKEQRARVALGENEARDLPEGANRQFYDHLISAHV